jgi:hypothetical protein
MTTEPIQQIEPIEPAAAGRACPRVPASPARRAGTSAWLLLLVLVVLGFGFVASRPDPPSVQEPPRGDVALARQAIQELLAPSRSATALDRLPPDFTRVTGVVPAQLPARDGTVRAVHLDGGCSTPWGEDNTRWDFAVPCKAHDLGYDLLRYADRKGHPLAPELREALDDRLSADMHTACTINPRNSAGTCELVASVYSAGLVLNSWHQRWGPPVGQPIAPILAGVVVIGFLLTFRMRGWLRRRRSRAPDVTAPDMSAGAKETAARQSRWALLGVAGIVLLVCGESAVTLARWGGVDADLLWPLTWLAQLSFVVFFAGGHANLGGWRAVTAGGGGYRQYLAHRAGWLLRSALVFAVAAFAMPMALELLGIPRNTIDIAVRVAAHPLWLLGVYVLTVALAPLMLRLHRLAPWSVAAGLLALVVLSGPAARMLDSALPGYPAALALALLAQQLAFAHASSARRPNRLVLGVMTTGAAAALIVLTAAGLLPTTLLGTDGVVPVLSAPAPAVLLLGVVQLGLLGLTSGRLRRFAANRVLLRAAAFALRAPMSLYLVFLAGMLLLVAVVHLHGVLGAGLGHLLRPQLLVALAMLAGPAALVFWWFERHHRAPAEQAASAAQVRGRLGTALSHAAAVLGIGYATVGVFGLALTGFGGGASEQVLAGLSLDPIQSLVHLLLGISLLHTLHTGTCTAPTTWLLTAVACVPPLLSATAAAGPTDTLALLVHGGTALFAVSAALASMPARRPWRRTTAEPVGHLT